MAGNKESDEGIINKTKKELQKKLEGFGIKAKKTVPNYMIDRTQKDKRVEVLKKLMTMLNQRFFLIDIADVLETNDYDRIDKLLEDRRTFSETIKKYNEQEGKDIKTFLRLKPVVGDNNARIYAEQEDKMRVLIQSLIDGKHLRKSRPGEEKEQLEDNISFIIDDPDFNRACQIEASYVEYEIDRVLNEIDSSKNDREYLSTLIEKLESLSAVLKDREDGYNTINTLVTGNERPIRRDDGTKNDNEGR